MTRLIIIRHGFSMGNKEQRFSGQWNVPLDEVGHRQAAATAEHIRAHYRVDGIYASDLCRAMDTVRPLAEALGMEVIPCKELREVDVGLWQGRLITDVAAEDPENFAVYRENPGLFRFPGGESYGDMQVRSLAAIAKIAGENEGKTLVIGTHGGTIRTLRAAWGNIPLDQVSQIPHVHNGSLTEMEWENGNAVFVRVGEDGHLPDKTTEKGVK